MLTTFNGTGNCLNWVHLYDGPASTFISLDQSCKHVEPIVLVSVRLSAPKALL